VTAPYLHDGSASTIEEAVRHHNKFVIDDGRMAMLLAFLDSLSDQGFLKDPSLAQPKDRRARKP
jgi:cytochrome c peroxidase